MLALCLMLSDTYYAHNYASIIGGCLTIALSFTPPTTPNSTIVSPTSIEASTSPAVSPTSTVASPNSTIISLTT